MKNIFICLFFLGGHLIAQERNPTYFDSFTKDANIQWAGWRMDTVHFTNINLSVLLRKKFEQNKIKVCIPAGIGDYAPGGMHYASKCEIKNGLHCGFGSMLDSLMNIDKKTKEEQVLEDEFIPENNFTDSSVFNVLDIPQLFYVEDYKLKVFIPFVITKRSVITSEGVNLGAALHFATSFNFNRLYKNSKNDKVLFLQETEKKIKLDSMFIGFETYQVKQLYERNLIGILWPVIGKENKNVLSAITNKKISMSELNDILNPGDKIPVPSFDSTGKLISSNNYFYRTELSPAVFKEIQISQKWYYNQTKNIVFCTISHVVLFAHLFKNGAFEEALTPVLKIIF